MFPRSIRTCLPAVALIATITAALGTGAAAQLPTTLKTIRVSVGPDGSELRHASELPQLSEDGRYLAFATRSPHLVEGDDNGTTDTFVRDLVSGTVELISKNSAGEISNGTSSPTSISPDGRFVVFNSDSSNLAENDDIPPNYEGALDVFVHDRVTHETERVSINSDEEAAMGPSFDGDVSADGRFVAFTSGAGNLDPDYNGALYSVYLRDRELGTTEIVDLSSSGVASNLTSMAPSISADGRFVAFDSNGSLTENDSNRAADVFVRDRELGTTTLLSIRNDGTQVRFGAVDPTITPDGRYVLLFSESPLVRRDKNGKVDAYLRDLETDRTTLVSRTSEGRVGNDNSTPTDISDDGRFVVFTSWATNIVPGDTNGDADTFMLDRVTKTVVRVNLNSRGKQARDDKGFHHLASISGDGRFVAFESSASNLIGSDTNKAYDIFLRGPYPGSGG